MAGVEIGEKCVCFPGILRKKRYRMIRCWSRESGRKTGGGFRWLWGFDGQGGLGSKEAGVVVSSRWVGLRGDGR